jgi:hypothetical protein
VAVDLPESIQIRRSELACAAVDNTKRTESRYVFGVLCNEKNLCLRIEDSHMLDGIVEILRQLPVVEKKEGDVCVHRLMEVAKP